jgi:YfiH family protein
MAPPPGPSGPFADALLVAELVPLGVTAFTTTRSSGSFGLGSTEPVHAVMERWSHLLADCRWLGAPAFACAGQVHGAAIEWHGPGWQGWLRGRERDGHVTASPGIALAVTVADCTPVFVAHPAGHVAVLHAGWRGTAAGILERGVAALGALGAPADELVMHCGPAICGACYEVGPEVLTAVTGRPATAPARLDLRAALAERARAVGVRDVSVSGWCTRCHHDRFFSHRAGDAGRQLGVILRPVTGAHPPEPSAHLA